jgi:hypothetical protein
MRFPQIETVALPCTFEGLVPGKLHEDGRRYLPLILLRLPSLNGHGQPRVATLGVVDRHHVVRPDLAGRAGVARLVLLLSTIRLQEPPRRQGLFAEPGLAAGRASTAPEALGRVVSVPSWEADREHLPYETLYTELVLDVGIGTVGVRTSATAASLAEQIGAAQIRPGDWLAVRRSRFDILAFEV